MKSIGSLVCAVAMVIGMLSVMIVPTTVISPPDVHANSYKESGSLLPEEVSAFECTNAGDGAVTVTPYESGYKFTSDAGWPYAQFAELDYATQTSWIETTADSGLYLNYDIEVVSGATNVIVYFCGQNPSDLAYAGSFFCVNAYEFPETKKTDGSSDYDLPVGHYKKSVPLTDIGYGDWLLGSNGEMLITGMKMFAVGVNEPAEVIIRDVSVGQSYEEQSMITTTTTTRETVTTATTTTATGGPVYAESGSLLPEEASEFVCTKAGYSGAEGTVTVTPYENGYKFISDTGWPTAQFAELDPATQTSWIKPNINSGLYLNYDIEVVSGATKVVVYFCGADPSDVVSAGAFFCVNAYELPDTKKADGDSDSDLSVGHYKKSVPLTDIGYGDWLLGSNGEMLITGMKMFAVASNEPAEVIIHDLSVGQSYEEQERFPNPITLSVNTDYEAQIAGYGSPAYYTFCPDKTDEYCLSIEYGYHETYIGLYDAQGMLLNGVYNGGDEAFVFSQELTAGKTYYYCISNEYFYGTIPFRFGTTQTITTAPMYLADSPYTRVPFTTAQTTTSPTGATTAVGMNDDFLYTVSGNQVTVTGYTGESKRVTVPATLGGYPVTAIGELAFAEQGAMESISLPNSLTRIEAYAFANCLSLTSITLPDGITSIEECAFAACSSLRAIELPSKLTAISERVFQYCESLEFIRIPEGVTTIGEGAFSSCDSLVTVVIPGSVTAVGEYTFDYWNIPHILFTGTKAQFKAIAEPLGVTDGQYHYDATGDEVQLVAEHYHCTQWGNAEYMCSLCEEEFYTQESIVPQGHIIGDNDRCVYCGAGATLCLTSPSPYDASASQRYMVRYPEAESVSVTFTEGTMLEDGYDFVYLYDANGVLQGEYTGDTLAGQTITLSGDTVELRLVSDSTECEAGFAAENIVPSGDAYETKTEPGDLNGDGVINMTDAFVTYKSVSAGTLTDAQKAVADMNGDGTVNMVDAYMLYKKAAGY